MNAMPNHQIFAGSYFEAANDDIAIVSTHLAARRTERRLMAVVSALAAAVLALTLVNGYYALQPLPDPTFAFRV